METNNVKGELGRGSIRKLCWSKSFVCAGVVLSVILLSACSGRNYRTNEYVNSYANQNVTQNYAAHNNEAYLQDCYLGVQAALTQQVFINNNPDCQSAYNLAYSTGNYGIGFNTGNALRGAYPTYNNTYNQGTVLRGSAPYGSADAYPYGSPKDTSGAYVSLGGIAYNVGESFYGIQGRFGYNFNANFALEGETSIGVKGEKASLEGIPYKAGIDYSTGIFAVGRLPVSENLSVHARVGYHAIKISAKTESASESEVFGGGALGVGLELATGSSSAIRVDYTRYGLCSYNNTATEFNCEGGVNSASVSFVHKF